ncbi:MAG: ABC transporter permease, partial [Alphaproteobacteria bacterium]
TMLFIGRGLILGLTQGRNVAFDADKISDHSFFIIGQTNALGFSNQIIILALVATLGGITLARTRWGYETYATGGNNLAARYAGINTHWVRIRAFLFSSWAATLAGLMLAAQDTGATSQVGVGAELIVIASVIVGGASILGGRGRVIGSVLGAILLVLIDRVLREGFPITKVVKIGEREIEILSMARLPPGAVPAFLGVILIAAVLIEPWIIRRKLIQRFVARLRGRPLPVAGVDSVAIAAVQTTGTSLTASEFHARGIKKLFTYRESAAVVFVIVLWLVGYFLRPDFWGNLDNSFNLLLAFTEIGIMAVGMVYVIGNGDIDLSVGAVLALSGSTAAFLMKKADMAPIMAAAFAFSIGTMAGVINGFLSTKAKLPAFVATLGMFYTARGLGAWLSGGRQLNQFPPEFNLIGRKLYVVLEHWGVQPAPDSIFYALTRAVSTQTIILAVLAIVGGIILAKTAAGYMVMATGGNRRAAQYAGINTDRVRFLSLVFVAMCASLAGLINIAWFRSFGPQAGLFRELDVIASVIIGGGSIFGGFGTVLGALAGAAVITLLRALLSLQVITENGSFVMPQHWVNVAIGLVLIIAVLSDIWFRQERIHQRLRWRVTKTGGLP